MNMNKNNNDNIVIRKIRYDNITMKQHASYRDNTEDWKNDWRETVDVLSTGCFTGCRAKYLKTVPGKWFKVDDVAEFVYYLKTLIAAELCENDTQVYQETDFNILLVKIKNGKAVELRYNTEFPEEPTPIVYPNIPGYVNKYIHDVASLNEYQLSICGEFFTNNWSELYDSISFCADERMGKWIPLDTLIANSCVGDQLPYVILSMIDLSNVRNGQYSDEDGICDDDKVGHVIVQLKDGFPVAVRYNHLYWMTDRPEKDVYDSFGVKVDDRLIEIEDRFSRLFTPEYYAEKESQEKLRAQIKEELRVEMRDELKAEVREEFIAELEAEKARKLSVWGRIKKWCGW